MSIEQPELKEQESCECDESDNDSLNPYLRCSRTLCNDGVVAVEYEGQRLTGIGIASGSSNRIEDTEWTTIGVSPLCLV